MRALTKRETGRSRSVQQPATPDASGFPFPEPTGVSGSSALMPVFRRDAETMEAAIISALVSLAQHR